MTSILSAGTIVAVSSSAPATFDNSGYVALSYTTVGEVDDIGGDIGRVYNLATRNPLSLRGPVKKKGSYNDGAITLSCAADYDDSGQDALRTALASDSPYSVKITLPNGDFIYFQALVMAAPLNIGGVDSFVMQNFQLEIVTSSTGVGIVVTEN